MADEIPCPDHDTFVDINCLLVLAFGGSQCSSAAAAAAFALAGPPRGSFRASSGAAASDAASDAPSDAVWHGTSSRDSGEGSFWSRWGQHGLRDAQGINWSMLVLQQVQR